MTAHESHEFTPNQGAAIDCMAAGMVDKQIASAMGVTVKAVERLIAHAREKVGAKTRTELVGIAVRRGLV